MSKKETKLQRYQQLQLLLKSSIPTHVEEFELEQLAGDFVALGAANSDIYIKYIPSEGASVFISDFDGGNRREVPFDMFSEEVQENILKMMTKAFIVNEIKEHL